MSPKTKRKTVTKKIPAQKQVTLGIRPNILEAENRLKQLTSFEINTIISNIVKSAKVRRKKRNTYE
jgi:hypothetical protein